MKLQKPVCLALLLCMLALCACQKTPGGGEEDAAPKVNNLGEAVTSDYIPLVADPLTGLAAEADYAQNRLVAVMINNHTRSLPQMGIQSAGMIYEMLAEGGITRLLAFYPGAQAIPRIGTLRSARHYYADIAGGFGAIYVHFGQSPQAAAYMKNEALAAVNGLSYDGTYFFRDAERRKKYGAEHSAYSDGESLGKAIAKIGYETDRGDAPLPFIFRAEPLPPAENPVTKVTVAFSGFNSKSEFIYDAQTGLYAKNQYNAPHLDQNTGSALTVKNVFVIEMPSHVIAGDTEGRLDMNTVGSGKGYYACDGYLTEIMWRKTAADTPMVFSYLDEEGAEQPLVLSRGNSYISCVNSVDKDVSFVTAQPTA